LVQLSQIADRQVNSLGLWWTAGQHREPARAGPEVLAMQEVGKRAHGYGSNVVRVSSLTVASCRTVAGAPISLGAGA
jgi:hypothetical protein